MLPREFQASAQQDMLAEFRGSGPWDSQGKVLDRRKLDRELQRSAVTKLLEVRERHKKESGRIIQGNSVFFLLLAGVERPPNKVTNWSFQKSFSCIMGPHQPQTQGFSGFT